MCLSLQSTRIVFFLKTSLKILKIWISSTLADHWGVHRYASAGWPGSRVMPVVHDIFLLQGSYKALCNNLWSFSSGRQSVFQMKTIIFLAIWETVSKLNSTIALGIHCHLQSRLQGSGSVLKRSLWELIHYIDLILGVEMALLKRAIAAFYFRAFDQKHINTCLKC